VLVMGTGILKGLWERAVVEMVGYGVASGR
jgi:hypothetical protein